MFVQTQRAVVILQLIKDYATDDDVSVVSDVVIFRWLDIPYKNMLPSGSALFHQKRAQTERFQGRCPSPAEASLILSVLVSSRLLCCRQLTTSTRKSFS